VIDRVFIFVALLAWALYLSATVGMRDDPPPSLPTHVYDPIGTAMRQRNERAEVECTGTVGDRRACWLQMKL
jgi:hypothetical protein